MSPGGSQAQGALCLEPLALLVGRNLYDSRYPGSSTAPRSRRPGSHTEKESTEPVPQIKDPENGSDDSPGRAPKLEEKRLAINGYIDQGREVLGILQSGDTEVTDAGLKMQRDLLIMRRANNEAHPLDIQIASSAMASAIPSPKEAKLTLSQDPGN
ncbi:MAG: hypothetical protein CYPHOPRED_005925, partial [Cyphobasidiales sp. Tagirdzhanova-0007]